MLVPTYNRGGALESVALDGVTYIDRIAYNARGQRLFVALGNGVMTRYAYDEDTFRLARMRSRQYSETDGVYAETGTKFQDNGYHYDLAGNILSVFDGSDVGAEIDSDMPGSIAGYPYGVPQSNTFWRQYTYDPLSRLLTATGACHDARAAASPWGDYPGLVQDLDEIRAFTEEYTYDANSNLASLKHLWDATTKYNRLYTVESGSNRLEQLENTTATTTYTYLYDAVGNMVQENTDRKMTWDYAGRMSTWRNQVDESAASVYAQYLYDAAGERVMKVVSKAGTDDVTTYIDGIFESRVHFDPVGGNEWNEELHIFDGSGRIARLRVGDPFDGDNTPEVIYVLSDHLGSSTVTLEDDGTFYSREEYTPYGESAFGSYAKKRYRFTGKEKDEESGLNYHSARYFAPWLGRWTSADPAGMVDGPNLYAYARGNPTNGRDPTGTQTGDVPLESPNAFEGGTTGGGGAPSSSSATGTTSRGVPGVPQDTYTFRREPGADTNVGSTDVLRLRTQDDVLAEHHQRLSGPSMQAQGTGDPSLADHQAQREHESQTLALLTVSWGAALGLLVAHAADADIHRAARLGLGAEGIAYGGGTVGGASRMHVAMRAMPSRPHIRMNVGSGQNPMKSAENVDKEPPVRRLVDVVADASTRLPFESGTMAEIHAINPYNFYPLNAETARLLKPGGVLMISGGLANKYAKPQAELAESLGLKLHSTVEGQIPEHQFGVQRTKSGGVQTQGQTYRTTIYFKPPR